ncbi:MAG: hypothetical protein CMI02_09830 [Oceanospirillaceae bacterium]|nr:hypothetical protein [Oceanospirillaceae bacterium]MBT12323.1 hypothetical protein [Oceanospirillaceae bacterium]|tara:strand:- start:31407 stop:31823 length:417 start_codon:yes stop_codon:yes gene_type:complete
MKLVQDLMTRELLTLNPADSLQDAEKLMKEHQIRHIPVVGDDGRIAGVLTQKEFLSQAFRITDKFGAHHLQEYLAKTPLSQCAETNYLVVEPTMLLSEAGRKLKEKRHGCLLVCDDDRRLTGLLTSQDFLRLAIILLD